MRIGNSEFDTENEFYIMGILNVTPDSFSDGGCFNDMDRALFHVEEMIQDGCDILDIGGESTRPDHIKISGEEEIDRVCPYIEAIKQRFDVPVSLDTYKADVARAGILAGADLINDIWGLKWNEALAAEHGMEYTGSMAQVISQYQIPSCLMHNRPKKYPDSQTNPFGYEDVMKDVLSDLDETLSLAEQAGIKKELLMLDPGIGFGKTLAQNLTIMRHLEMLAAYSYPVLLGTSRKSMIGLTLNLPVEQREEGTIATSVIGAMKGCTFFRVHDVKKNRRALDMTRAILNV